MEVDCEHEEIEWGYLSFSYDRDFRSGHCRTCGLFIHEENGRYFLPFNDRTIHLYGRN